MSVNSSSSGYNPSVQDEINLALAQSGGFARIEAAFRQRLDEQGWSQNLKQYCTHLFRSGQVTTYDEALTEIMKHVRWPGGEKKGQMNGSGDAPDLVISQDAAEGGAEAVKKELAKVCKMK